MIKNFSDKQTEIIFSGGDYKRIDKGLAKKAKMRMEYLSAASCLEDLYFPPSNRFHKLQGFNPIRYAINVNEQWRIVFEWENNHAVNVCFTDYH
jgi:proteic killer suppression protein